MARRQESSTPESQLSSGEDDDIPEAFRADLPKHQHYMKKAIEMV